MSSSGTPHKRDSFLYSTWLEDSISTTSGGSSPGDRPSTPSQWGLMGGQGAEGRDHSMPPVWVCDVIALLWGQRLGCYLGI